MPVLATDGRTDDRQSYRELANPSGIDQSSTIRCAATGRTLFIAPGSTIDLVNLGAAEQLNPTYLPALQLSY